MKEHKVSIFELLKNNDQLELLKVKEYIDKTFLMCIADYYSWLALNPQDIEIKKENK